jgi:hypothetical protein
MSGNAAHRRPEDAAETPSDPGLVPSDDARFRRRLVVQIIRRAKKAGRSPHVISKMLLLQRCGFWLSPENVTTLLERWSELEDTGLTIRKRLDLVTPATSDPLPDVDQSENLIRCYDSDGICRMTIAGLGPYLRPRSSGTEDEEVPEEGPDEEPRHWFSRRNPDLVLIRTDNNWLIEIDLVGYVGKILSRSEAQEWLHVHGRADELPAFLFEVVVEPDHPTGRTPEGDRTDPDPPPGVELAAAGQGGIPREERPTSGSDASGSKRGPFDEPPREAINAYRAVKLLGQRQREVAERFGVDQGTISRWLKRVKEWLEAGNILPDLDAPTPKTVAMDPRKLEQGPRQR